LLSPSYLINSNLESKASALQPQDAKRFCCARYVVSDPVGSLQGQIPSLCLWVRLSAIASVECCVQSTVLTIGLVFFICFRECLECSIIVSVLLAFLKQTLGPEHDAAVRKRLVRQVWAGVGLGVVICLIICAGVIGTCESLAPS
jgi:hypothetical protein